MAQQGPIRYAMVGLGHIAQVAVLPAFAHAGRNSRLTALVSDDRTKLKAMAKKYQVDATFSYADYDACLAEVDAVGERVAALGQAAALDPVHLRTGNRRARSDHVRRRRH